MGREIYILLFGNTGSENISHTLYCGVIPVRRNVPYTLYCGVIQDSKGIETHVLWVIVNVLMKGLLCELSKNDSYHHQNNNSKCFQFPLPFKGFCFGMLNTPYQYGINVNIYLHVSL